MIFEIIFLNLSHNGFEQKFLFSDFCYEETSYERRKMFLFGLKLALKSKFLDGLNQMSQQMMTRTAQKSKKSIVTRYDVIFLIRL